LTTQIDLEEEQKRDECIMSLEKNKAIIRRLFEAENRKDLTLLDEFIAPDFLGERNTPFEMRGLESYKQFEDGFIKAFPDFQETIEDIIAEGDRVWVCFKLSGTHTGKWNLFGLTVAPTGKKVTFTAVYMWRIVNDKVVERKSIRDMLDFLGQIGLIELTEKGEKLFPDS
jgi:predicted ester cyclase